MKLLDSQTGKSYEFPDDVTEQEVQQFLARERNPVQRVPMSELREQPSPLQEAIQPGGIASPENVGALGGGLMGASYGAAFGPPGIALGGLVGAGLGALTGRGGEVLARRLYGDTAAGPIAGTVPLEMRPQPTLRDDLADIGAASQRGIIAEAMGQVGGQLLTKGVKTLAEPFVGRVDPARAAPKTFREVQERARLNAAAEELSIPTSAGVQTKHRGLSLIERMTEDVPIGVQPAEEFTKRQQHAIERALDDFTETLAPRTLRDALTAGQAGQSAKLARQQAATEAASQLYDDVGKKVAGRSFPAPALRAEAERFLRVEQELAGVQTPVAGRLEQLAPRLTEEAPSVPTQRPSALGLTANDIAVDPNKSPAAFLAANGLAADRPLSFETLREIQSRLGELARNAGQAGQRRVAGQYKQLFKAVSRDIESVGEQMEADGIPGVNDALQKANAFYRAHVVSPFFQDFFTKGKRAFDNIDPQDAAAVVFRPGVTQQHLQMVKQAVGPKAYDGMLAAHVQETVNRAVNPQSGQFEVGRFLTQWGPKQYRDTSLQEMFGERYADFRQLRDVLQNIQDSSLGAANPSGTARRIGTAGQLTGIISFALNNPGATVGGLIGGALGKKAGDAGMIAGGIAGGIAGNYLGGELDLLPGGEYAGGLATAGGIVALSPIGLSRVLFHPQGIKWLTEGLRVGPGTEQALRISARLIALANKPTPAEASPVEELRTQVEEQTGKRVVTPPKTFREALQGMTVQ